MNQLLDKISWGFVCAIGILLIVLTWSLFGLADEFAYGQPPNRPIVNVVLLSWLASVVALCGLFFGLRVKSNFRVLVGVIVLVAVSTRLLLVFSNPILEVDFYRYLWDGIAANQGVAPYKYSPDAVLRSNADDPELQVLQAAIQESPSAFTIVSRVHFEEYTTLYPRSVKRYFVPRPRWCPTMLRWKLISPALNLCLCCSTLERWLLWGGCCFF